MASTDDTAEASVLGKRDRNAEQENGLSGNKPPLSVSKEDEDVSDDDVGPMPMPEDSNGTNTRKKRSDFSNKHSANTLL